MSAGSLEHLRLVYQDLAARIQGDRDTSWRIFGLGGILIPLAGLIFARIPPGTASMWYLVATASLLVSCLFFLACSPELDPGVMRVSTARMGKEILDEQREATES